MYRVHLDEAGRAELDRGAHEPGVTPRARDWLEMVRLSDAGWSVPRIAVHLRTSERRVRKRVKAFLAEGFDALCEKPHPGDQSSLTPEILTALREEVGKGDRTWTAPQIEEWLAEKHNVRLAPRTLRRWLRRAKLSYKRTSRSLKHKQNGEEVTEKAKELAELEKGETPSA
jgi:transposase